MTMTTDNRSDWKWLEGTYWYCAADSMPAVQGQGTHSFGWVIDQTVWFITGYWDGYFWGVASVLLTKAGETPDPAGKKDMTFLASITPEGQVYIAFIRSAVASTVGTGRMTSHQEKPSFEMQMSSGPGAAVTLHWAYMMQVRPGDPEWTCLPGTGVSVESMVSGIEPPAPVPPG
jgi:hypothetical protein